MTAIITIGLDLAKKVFQVHCVDAEGKVVVARKLRRKEVLVFFAKLAPCLVGMEACGSAHYWAREIAKFGHTVKLMPSKYVKAYVKRGKTDAGDAAAIAQLRLLPRRPRHRPADDARLPRPPRSLAHGSLYSCVWAEVRRAVEVNARILS
jgi:transposase